MGTLLCGTMKHDDGLVAAVCCGIPPVRGSERQVVLPAASVDVRSVSDVAKTAEARCADGNQLVVDASTPRGVCVCITAERTCFFQLLGIGICRDVRPVIVRPEVLLTFSQRTP